MTSSLVLAHTAHHGHNQHPSTQSATALYSSTAVTCEIKLFWNYFDIISLFCFTRNHVWNWNTEMKLFRCWKSFEIVSKSFQQHWTPWRIFMSCNKPLKWFCNNVIAQKYYNFRGSFVNVSNYYCHRKVIMQLIIEPRIVEEHKLCALQ